MKRMLFIVWMLVCLLAAPALAEEMVYILEAPGPCDTVALLNRPEGEALAHYYTGTPVKVLTRQGENGLWAYVQVGEGEGLITGWVNGASLTRVPNPNAMPDLLHYASPLADLDTEMGLLRSGLSYSLMGETETGLWHLLLSINGEQSCFIPKEQLTKTQTPLYAMIARETLLREEPDAAKSGITLYPGVAVDVHTLDIDWCYVSSVASSDLKGYVPTRDLAFGLDIVQVVSGCPSVRLTQELTFRDAEGEVALTYHPGTLVLQIASTADQRYIRTWEGDFLTAWIPADHAEPVGMGRLGFVNGLNVCGFARLNRECSLYKVPQANADPVLTPYPAGTVLPIQSSWNGWLQTPEGFLPADAAETYWLQTPEAGGAPGFYTVILQEGGQITLSSGERYTAPGTYQFLLREGEALTLSGAARIQPQSTPAAVLDYFTLEVQGSGRFLGWFNTISRGDMTLSMEITALGSDSCYAVTPVGGTETAISLAEGERVQESLSVTDFLTYQNCRIALLPGNG